MTDETVLFDLQGVSHSYGSDLVLDDVTFQVHRSDFLALIGPNGSGKSTLIKIMLGLIRPDAGTLRILGRSVGEFSQWQRIGYVPQRATELDPLFPASAREVVALGLLAEKRFPRFMARRDRALIDEALELVGMEDYGGHHIGSLSGGQQQRVFIARALVSRPAVLVLDEPTAGVDAGTQERFYDLLHRINRDREVTLVLVTHDIGVVTKHVNKVACLNQKLVFHGSHEDFCESEQAITLFGPESHLICHRH